MSFYFRPVLKELLEHPRPRQYLRLKMRRIAGLQRLGLERLREIAGENGKKCGLPTGPAGRKLLVEREETDEE